MTGNGTSIGGITPSAGVGPFVRRLSLLLLLVILTFLLVATSALALSQRGHVYASSFAGQGSGDGRLLEPSGIAVSETGEAAGDVYVLDRGNSRIDRLGPDGSFIAAWGWGVKDGKKEYEVCEKECRPGIPGIHKGQLDGGALAIAVDNSQSSSDPSKGDVYLVTEGGREEGEGLEQIDKFTPAGQLVELVRVVKYREPGQREAEKVELLAEEAHGLAVAPDGTVWFYYETGLYGLSDIELRKPTEQRFEAEFEVGEGEPRPGLAVGGSEEFLLGHDGQAPDVISLQRVFQAQVGGPRLRALVEELDPQNTLGVAADQKRGDAYLDNVTSVAAFTAEGVLVERFGGGLHEGKPVLQDASAVAVDAQTRDVYATDAATGQIVLFTLEESGPPSVEDLSVQDVSVRAAQLNATVDPRGASKPTIVTFEYGTAPCASSPCTEVPGGVLGGPSFADEGFGEQGVSVHLGEHTSFPLLAGTTYHYRLTALNEHGQVRSGEGAFSTLPSTTGGEALADQRVWEMVSPSEKGGALILPLLKNGGLIQASVDGRALAYIANAPFAGAEGSRSVEDTQLLACSVRQPACAAHAPPGSAWFTQDVSTPNEHGNGLQEGEPPEYQAFSSDLALSLLYPFPGGGSSLAEPPLTPPGPGETQGHQEKTMYERADQPIVPGESESVTYGQAQQNGLLMHNPGYVALVDAANVTSGEPFGQSSHGRPLRLAGASPDLAHVVVASPVRLTGEKTLPGAENLYEASSAGVLQLINVLPGVEPALPATLGSGGVNVRNAISTDGSRVVFSTNSPEHLYLRDTSRGETIQLDTKQEGASGEGLADPVFQSASTDTRTVFFTDEQRLTPDSRAASEAPDLYAFTLTSAPGEPLSGRVSDLSTTTTSESEPANVRGLVIGADEAGTVVYFVAEGVLSTQPNGAGEAASAGHCASEAPSAICNLYVERYDAHTGKWLGPVFIAGLSGEDSPDWQPRLKGNGYLGQVTSRVSANGSYLAFMSERSLTGYDNRATDPQAKGARAEEVFLYDASANRLLCASCDPSGARPRGVLDPVSESGQNPEGLGLLVDRSKIWKGRWLAGSVPGWTNIDPFHARYQSRYLSNTGRLFFQSPEPLVAADSNAKQDVYEYEPQGVPRGPHECTSHTVTFSQQAQGCVGLVSSGTASSESAFLDASETGGEGEAGEQLGEGGGDVFFLTVAKLVPADTDPAFDVYDAHECAPVSPCIPPVEAVIPPVCESSNGCRPPVSGPSSPPAGIVSGTTGVSGNLPVAQPKSASLGVKTNSKTKPLTRAQLLARALRSCRKLKGHKQRARCEAQARKHYAKPKSKHGKAARRRAGRWGGRR